MARPLRVEYEGAIYHVTVRGNDRREIFLDDRDRQRFVLRLGDCVEAHEVRLYLFCLMTNHVHLMLETPGGNLSGFMQWVRGMHDKLTGKQRPAEDVTLRRRPRRLPAERVIQIVCRELGADRRDVARRQRDSLLRPITARMLCRYSGLTQRQTGELLNLSTGAAVSMQLKTLAAAAAAKGKLRRQLTAIEKAICDAIDRESEASNVDN